jgi:hypothetical protein
MPFQPRPGERAQRVRELRPQYWRRLQAKLGKHKRKWMEAKRVAGMKFALSVRFY